MNKFKKILMPFFIAAAILMVSCDKGPETVKVEKGFLTLSEQMIKEDNAMNIIKELTSAKYKGRLVGTEGNKLTEDYIANYFKNIGLENPEGLKDYKQEFIQSVKINNSAPKLQIINKHQKIVKEFSYPKNFTSGAIMGSKLKGKVEAEIVRVEKLNELRNDGEKFKDKIILVPGDVRREAGNNAVLFTAVNKIGVKGVVLEVNISDPKNPYKHLPISPAPGDIAGYDNEKGPAVFLVEDKSFKEISDAGDKGMKLSMELDFVSKNVKASNVVGIIRGNDKKLRDEYIIVSGHFDHVGDNMNGSYNPGALDNASGAAAMMEIARVLKQSEAPKKSIAFIAFNGEEEGLYGSYNYAQNPIFPLEKTILINLDMVGSKNTMPLTLAGWDETELRKDLYEIAEYLKIKSEKSSLGASDHSPFVERGVQAVSLVNLDIENEAYHTPYDTMERTVDSSRIKEVIKLVLYYIDKNAYKAH